MPDDKDFIEQLKEIGGLRHDFIDPFRNEDGTEACAFCDFSSASETALDSHIKHEHTAEEWRVWQAFCGQI